MLPFWPGQQVGADFGCLFILFCDLLFVWSLSFFDIFGKSASRYSTMVSHCSDWQILTSFMTLLNYFRDIFIYSVMWFAFCVVAVIFWHIWQEHITFSLLWLVIVLTGNFLLASWLLLIILEISWSRPSHQRKAMAPQYSLLCLRASLCMIRAVAHSPNLLSHLQMELSLQAHKKVSYLREA